MAVRVVDFFCGCGGTSKGLENAGMEIALGLDNDSDAASTYRLNFPQAAFIEKDINSVTFAEVERHLKLKTKDSLVFCGCAPCQPFSKINTVKPTSDDRKHLLSRFGEFVEHFLPDYVLVENVPGLQIFDVSKGPFKDFVELLERLGYSGSRRRFEVVQCQFYGVPQCRRRLVLLATRHGDVAPWPVKTHGPGGTICDALPTVWEMIGHLPPIRAGEKSEVISDHQAMELSPLNLRRIQATPPEKGRETWPPELQLACHRGHTGHTDVYGRMRKHAPAAALTTRCISLSNGRFGHPEQDRAISIREAALLQTFPIDFLFCGSLGAKARQIGNAVPVALAAQLGKAVVTHERSVRRGATIGEV